MVSPFARPTPLSRSLSTLHDADAGSRTEPAYAKGEPAGIRHIRVFVSSPGDTTHERGRVDRVVERLNGESEACQEFFSDVRIPDSDRLGEIDAGCTVGTRWMYHERVGHNSPYVTMPVGLNRGGDELPRQAALPDLPGRSRLDAGRHAAVCDHVQQIADQPPLVPASKTGNSNAIPSPTSRMPSFRKSRPRSAANARRTSVGLEAAGRIC